MMKKVIASILTLMLLASTLTACGGKETTEQPEETYDNMLEEIQATGKIVMAVSPGWVKTEFFDHALQTSNDAVTYYNRLYEAKDVMKTALHDLYRTKKDVSIHGLPVRWQVRLVKLLPHKLVMDIWMKQQKHNKLPDED